MHSMEEWRRHALELFPQWQADITSLDLIELSLLISDRVVAALGDGRHAVPGCAAKLATWAWARGKDEEALMHFAMDMLSQSLQRESLRRELWRALPEDLFRSLVPAFCGILRRDAVSELEREYRHIIR